jgi:tetratricopeptide (TPR) repeat protein
MDQIEFPPEIAIFADRIDDQWLGKIQMAFVENQKTKSHLKLSDWLEILQELYLQEKQLPKEVWALSAKLAWIQAEVSFFISNSDLIDNIKNDPLCLCYFGAGFAELIDFEKGFKLLQQAVSLAKSNSDWYALIDMMIPYSIVMSNTENKQELKEFHGFINQVIAKELNSDPYYQSLVSSCCFFSREKIDASEDDKIKEQLQASLSHGHHLNSALLYNQLSKKNDESSYKRNMENGIKELNKIDARLRILIAYTNLGIFYASKAKYEISEGFFDQAFAIIKNISLSKKYGR